MAARTRYRPAPIAHTLPPGFSDPVDAAQFPAHTLRWRNQRAAETVGLDDLTDDAWRAAFHRFEPLAGNLPRPLAMRYHGHQFGHYNPDLGDGRGFLFAQLREHGRGRLMDLGTKGTGPTPWSRGGDGMLTLQGAVRELLAAELLEARGVPTCRVLSVFETGEPLWRHDEPSPTRSAVLVRLSHSHIRIGSFQRPAYERSTARVQALLEHAVEHHWPHLIDAPDLPAVWLEHVSAALADTVAAWTIAGFVHGVLNTDNLNVTGESFDYGPWRFTEWLDADRVAAYFDGDGRYAFGRQPEAIRFGLDQLARSLELVGDPRTLRRALARHDDQVRAALRIRLLWRLGLVSRGATADTQLLRDVAGTLQRTRFPLARFAHDWYGGAAARPERSPLARLYDRRWFTPLARTLRSYSPARPDALDLPGLTSATPVTLAHTTVEALWAHIAERDDWSPLHEKVVRMRALGEALGPPPCTRLAAMHGHKGRRRG